MTRRSVLEYAAAVRERYLGASRAEKKVILDEFCKVTGQHRKSAIRLLHRVRSATWKRQGRPRTYGSEFIVALKIAWEATDHVCSKHLVPFLPKLVPILEHHGELRVSEAVHAQLLSVSASTIDRVLKPYRQKRRHGLATTHAVTGLKALIPIRTFADKHGLKVGHMEVDLAAHCGASVEGFYLNTLTAVDIASGWNECVPVWGKGQSRILSAIERVRRQVPFPLLSLNSDNGGEFINHALWRYCKQKSISFVRSRSYKKNDQARVEQKNWFVVRRRVGYDRFNSHAAFDALDQLYNLVRLHTNLFQPISKLVATHREGAKVHRLYDLAQTPCERLLASDALTTAQRETLTAYYQCLNPLQLQAEIEKIQRGLWKLACPDPRSDAETKLLLKLEAQATQEEEKTHKGKVTHSFDAPNPIR